ncbi:MAG: tripartite tricarboxylate transporter TctB family protein [Clostridiaceae bacterium]|nr:tripartite tricarboxylate transporter TctB family protein [Clostridiaceae bacterium]
MKKLVLKKNLSSGIIAACMGILFRVMLPYSIKAKVHTVTSAVGPDYLPKLVIYGMILFGAGLVFLSLVLKKDEMIEIDLGREGHVLIYFALLLAYMTAMKYVGFLMASMAFSAVSMWLMEDRNWRHYLYIELLVVVIFASFKYGLQVPLPTVFL